MSSKNVKSMMPLAIVKPIPSIATGWKATLKGMVKQLKHAAIMMYTFHLDILGSFG